MMSNETKLTYVEPPTVEILEAPGFNTPARGVMYTIAGRLVKHYQGKVPGKSGQRGTGNSWEYGDLSTDEALYTTQYCLTRGLNPFGDVHLWWYKGLQICEHYRILSGWANLRDPYISKTFPLTSAKDRELHGLQDGDIGSICYILKRKDTAIWQSTYQTIVQAMIQADKFNLDAASRAAYDATCPSAVGIVSHHEMTNKKGVAIQIEVKGWSWQQRADTRAFRNVIGQSHGTPTPAEVKAYNQQMNPGLSLEALAHPDFDPGLPDPAQQRYFQLQAQADQSQAESQGLTVEAHNARLSNNTDLLRGPQDSGIDDDYTGVEPDRSEFIAGVMKQVPFYVDAAQINNALTEMELTYDIENEQFLFDALAEYAEKQAQATEAAEAGAVVQGELMPAMQAKTNYEEG